MEEIWCGPHEYDFTYADQLIDFARNNGLHLRGHTLVWSYMPPDWLAESSLAGEDLLSLIDDYIEAVITHVEERYPGGVLYWNVVNEPLDDDGTLRSDFFGSRTGGGYIYISLVPSLKRANSRRKPVCSSMNTESNRVGKSWKGYCRCSMSCWPPAFL
ncbi:MAG: endo-1,4-beta-xylanase [Spirochaetes bacterium]|nr:endo-1,4-beta-xylanase [Spirochaetota bacterium]MBU0955154.1 endo-1,4-beta-xylanase [Spirochaetota bacterium]